MSDEILLASPHRRWNPLKREWVLVSPQRALRPWQGQVETPSHAPSVQHDAQCYLCPGNERAGGKRTPEYSGTYVFDNDFAALLPEVAESTIDVGGKGLMRAAGEPGLCRVICFDPRHDLTLATMEVEAIERVAGVWAEQEEELSAREDIGYVQIFENRGAMMGASNPHPHGQIWATRHVPNEPAAEQASQAVYLQANGTRLLEDYLALELQAKERVVAENDGWVALVPFWAVWPFEVMLLPRKQAATLHELSGKSRKELAGILKTVCAGYDRVFETPFPYSMGFHGAPCDGGDHGEWTLHAHFYPPLLRSATVRKFMVGFELLGSPQRDISAEIAAAKLREAMKGNSR